MIVQIGEVKLIGQQLQGIQQFPFFKNTGVVRVFFHKSGSVEHSNNLIILNKFYRGMHKSLADSLRQNNGQPLGPGNLVARFSCFNLSNTIALAGVIMISVNIELQLSSWYWEIDVQSSSVKTLVISVFTQEDCMVTALLEYLDLESWGAQHPYCNC